MGDAWSDAISKQLLVCPWSCHPSEDPDKPNLLVKFNIQTSPKLLVHILVTDLEECFFEGLNQDSYYDSQASQTQDDSETMLGVGEEGEIQLLKLVEELSEGISSGKAEVTLSHASYEHIVTITLPGSFSFRFICDPLHTAAAACISTHLLVPLLGISSSLLSMVKEEDTKALSEAVDASAKAKRLKEGRATRIFFDVGATAMGRWVQAHKGVKERDRIPITLVKPTSRTHSPPTTIKAPPIQPKQPPSKPTIAQQLLDHRAAASSSGTRGERIKWDDAQSREPSLPPPPAPPPSSKAKGKKKENLPSIPPPEEHKLTPPPPHQPSPAKRRVSSDSESPMDVDCVRAGEEPDSGPEPDTELDSEDGIVPNFGSQSQSQSQPPIPKQPSLPPPVPTPPVQSQADKKKAEKKVGEEAEMKLREQSLAKAREAAKVKKLGAMDGGVKKKKKKL